MPYSIRIALFIAFCALAGFAPQGHAILWSGNAPSAPSCPESDGSAGATGDSAQYPTLLTGLFNVTYPATIKSQLGCLVAGVDYAVGLTSAQISALQDPTTAGLPSGCSYSSNKVTCSSNATISGFDFSLHNGLQLVLSGAHTFIVTANKFGVGSNCLAPVVNSLGANTASVTLTYNNVDGGGATCSSFSGGTVGMFNFGSAFGSGSTLVVSYNNFTNVPEDAIDMSGPSSGILTPTINNNVYHLQGWIGHPDGIQECAGNITNLTIKFNTYITYYQGTQISQPFHTEAQSPCTSSTADIESAVTKFNTMVIAQSSTGTGSVCTGGSYPTNCGSNYAIACKQDAPGAPQNQNNNYAAYGNYIDSRGALSATTNDGCPSPTFGSPYHDVNMVTGANID